MPGHNMAELLAIVLLAIVSVTSAEEKSSSTVVNLVRPHRAGHDSHARGGNLNPDTYEGGVYKVAYDACQTQLSSAMASVQITLSDGRKTLDAENVPPACMTISGALTNNFAEGYLIPMGSDKLKITDVTEDTINRVQHALEVIPSTSGSHVEGNSTASGGNVTSMALTSTSSMRMRIRHIKRKVAREAASRRVHD